MPSSQISYIAPSSRLIPTPENEYEKSYRDPWRSCLRDVGILLRNITYLPWVIIPLRSTKSASGASNNVKLLLDYIVVAALLIVEVLLLPTTVVAVLVLPGIIFVLYSVAVSIIVLGLASRTWQRGKYVESTIGLDPQRSDEMWVFVNGIGTSYNMLQSTCDMLSRTFHRRIIGIHNRSYGILFDVIQCLMQRSYTYHNSDTNMLYLHLRQYLEDATVKKLVVIAHSQGGMITSLAMDNLYDVIPGELFSKMEIYTFGSAASHFHNPSKVQHGLASKSTSTKTEATKATTSSRYVPIIEHYVNAYDIVPRWGVLYYIRNRPTDSYAGTAFIHESQSGHLFDAHYLATMFPAKRCDDDQDPALFLNLKVVETGPGRLVRVRTQPKIPNGTSETRVNGTMHSRHLSGGKLTTNGGILSKRGGEASWQNSEEVSRNAGVTVRELSNLWKYFDGRTV